jgi:threonine synthase
MITYASVYVASSMNAEPEANSCGSSAANPMTATVTPRPTQLTCPTVCGGIEIERPARGEEILAALRASGGAAVASEDEDVLRERDRLARLEGVYAEPTSAAAFSGLAALARAGRIGRDEVVVVAVTGSGLKDPGPD